jgi:outer membrane protein assembly factor BamB
VLFCLWAIGCVVVTAQGEDWPQWLGPNRNGVTTSPAPLTAWAKEGPEVKWRVKCGEGCATPVVSGGRVILVDRTEDTERIRCLSTSEGKELWEVKYRETAKVSKKWGQGIRCTPAIDEAHVYVLGIGGQLTCAAMETGEVLWQKREIDFPTISHKSYGVYGSPLVVGDAVVLMHQFTPAVVALDKRTGRRVWQALSTYYCFGTPQLALLAGRRQIVVGVRSHMAGLEPKTGAVLWKHPQPKLYDALTTPVVYKDVVVFNGYGVPTYAFEVRPGGSGPATKDLWQSREVRPWFNAAVAHKGRLYCCNQLPGKRGGLVCCDVRTGRLLWRFRVRGFGSNVSSWVLVVGEKLLVQTEDGRLILGQDAGDAFKELARAKVLGKPVFAMPSFADGCLYMRNFTELVCLRLAGKGKNGHRAQNPEEGVMPQRPLR